MVVYNERYKTLEEMMRDFKDRMAKIEGMMRKMNATAVQTMTALEREVCRLRLENEMLKGMIDDGNDVGVVAGGDSDQRGVLGGPRAG